MSMDRMMAEQRRMEELQRPSKKMQERLEARSSGFSTSGEKAASLVPIVSESETLSSMQIAATLAGGILASFSAPVPAAHAVDVYEQVLAEMQRRFKSKPEV